MVFAWCSLLLMRCLRARRSRHMRGSGGEGEREFIGTILQKGERVHDGRSDRQVDTERGGEKHRESEREGERDREG